MVRENGVCSPLLAMDQYLACSGHPMLVYSSFSIAKKDQVRRHRHLLRACYTRYTLESSGHRGVGMEYMDERFTVEMGIKISAFSQSSLAYLPYTTRH